jgi:Fe-S cluster assembly iron-binding protein IscA
VVVDQALLKTTGEITIDFVPSGFRAGLSITSKNPLRGKNPADGCSCGCG